MRPWLADRGIDVVAMTHAPAKEVLAQIERDHLGFPIIIDQDLEVTRRLGWFDRAGLKHVTWRIFGVPIGFPVSFRRMPREKELGEAVVGEDALHDVDYDLGFRLGHVSGPGCL